MHCAEALQMAIFGWQQLAPVARTASEPPQFTLLDSQHPIQFGSGRTHQRRVTTAWLASGEIWQSEIAYYLSEQFLEFYLG